MIIPIGALPFPDSAAALRTRIEEGARQLGLRVHAHAVQAPDWPAVEALMVDFSHTTLSELDALPRWEGRGERSLRVGSLQWRAQPLSIRGLPLDLDLQAQEAHLGEVRLSQHGTALALQSAREGTLQLSAATSELERLAQTLLAGQAQKHGADIVQTRLHFTSRGPRALSFQAEVTAKVMMMKAPITVGGDVDLDDSLQLRVSNLKLTGSGMAASLAQGFLQPHFDKIQQRPISLRALAPGELRLRDISLAIDGERLRLSGTFGS